MKSKTAERILSETPQETKNKVRETTNEMVGINPQTFEIVLDKEFTPSRGHQLLRLGFEKNEHQRCFQLLKYEEQWIVTFWKISDYNDQKWNILIEDIRYDLSEVKKQYFEGLRQSLGYELAQKEIKKKLLDKLNHLRADYENLTRSKLDKRSHNFKVETELQANIVLLKGLLETKNYP